MIGRFNSYVTLNLISSTYFRESLIIRFFTIIMICFFIQSAFNTFLQDKAKSSHASLRHKKSVSRFKVEFFHFPEKKLNKQKEDDFALVWQTNTLCKKYLHTRRRFPFFMKNYTDFEFCHLSPVSL